MKNAKTAILVVILSFVCVVTGFFLGRNTIQKPIVESNQQFSYSNHTTSNVGSDTNGLININTASSQQLQMLPDIGEVLADRIIAYRDDFGPFTCVEDLLMVNGIGEKRIEKLRPYITLGG